MIAHPVKSVLGARDLDGVFFARVEGVVGALGRHHQLHLLESSLASQVAALAGVGHEQVGGGAEDVLDDQALHQAVVDEDLVGADFTQEVGLRLLEGFTAGEDLFHDAVVDVELTLDVGVGFGDGREEAAALTLLGADFALAVAITTGDRVTQDLGQLVALDVGDAGGLDDFLDVAVQLELVGLVALRQVRLLVDDDRAQAVGEVVELPAAEGQGDENADGDDLLHGFTFSVLT
jgi:hypothetical protein